jgi:hypothetical protein
MEGHNSIKPLATARQNIALAEDAKQRLDFAFHYVKRYPESATELRLQRAKQLLEIIHSPTALKTAIAIPELPPRPVRITDDD